MVKFEFALSHLWLLSSSSSSPFACWFWPNEVVSWCVVCSCRGVFWSILQWGLCVFFVGIKNSVSSKPNPLSSPKYTLLIFLNKIKASKETLISSSFPPPSNQYPPGLGVETSEPKIPNLKRNIKNSKNSEIDIGIEITLLWQQMSLYSSKNKSEKKNERGKN